MKVLVVVDVQNDFIDRALGSEAAQAIMPNVREKIQKYRESDNYVIFTKDTHDTNYMRSAEGKYLPIPHCIFNTEGWEIRYYPNKSIKVTADAACCAGSSLSAHEAALTVMKSCQIEVKE